MSNLSLFISRKHLPFNRGGAMAILFGLGIVFAPAQTPLTLITPHTPSVASPAGGNADSGLAILSPDGRYVLFASGARNLTSDATKPPLPAPLPAPMNVFLRDRTAGTTVLISASYTGTYGGNEDSYPVAVATNGQFVLFESNASNLVPGDTNGVGDVFVRDVVNGRTILVSVGLNGAPGNGESGSSAITPDGRFITFASSADNLVSPDSNKMADIFVRDVQAGTTTLVSVGALSPEPGLSAEAGSVSPLITPDGRFIAFYSTATNLAPGVPNPVTANGLLGSIYVRDLVAGTTAWASRGAAEAVQSAFGETDATSFNHAISDDGRFVAYEASPLDSDSGVILRADLQTGSTQMLHSNAAADPVTPYENIMSLAMTPNGRFVAFVANSDDTPDTTCILLSDAQTTNTILVSGDTTGQVPANTTCSSPALDASGRFVAFLSDASLVTNALSGDAHVYVRDLETRQTTLADLDFNGAGAGVDVSTTPWLSADGRLVAFDAPDGNLVTNDINRSFDVFVRDLPNATTELISVVPPSLQSITGHGSSLLSQHATDASGRFLVFFSDADDLVANDTNQQFDVFLQDLVTGSNTVVSLNTNGLSAHGSSSEAVISPDGRYVVFTSSADDLTAGDTNHSEDVYLRDLQKGTTTLVSARTGTMVPGDGDSYSPLLVGGGRFVFFHSTANNLAAGSFSRYDAFYLRDLESVTTYPLTIKSSIGVAPAITPDGRWVAVADQGFGGVLAPPSILVWDTSVARFTSTNSPIPDNAGFLGAIALRPDGQFLVCCTSLKFLGTDLAAHTNWDLGLPAYRSSPSSPPVFSPDGRFLAYASATNYGPVRQLYLYDFQTGTNFLVSRSYVSGGPGNADSDCPAFSPDGRFIAFRSSAGDLAPNDNNNVRDAFLFDRLTGNTILLSTSRFGSFSANSFSEAPIFSGDSQTLLFASVASDLVLNDFNNQSDIFAFHFNPSSSIPPFSAQVLPAAKPGASPTLTWQALPGKTYRVQFKYHLEDAVWQDVTWPISLVGSNGYLCEPNPKIAQKFFRIIAL